MVMSLTPELRTHFGAPDDRGVLVAHVEPGTPAAAAGLAVGDVIVNVQGQKIDAASDVLAALASLGKGQHAKIDLVRDGKSRSLEATLTTDASRSGMWLDDWMKSFLGHHPFGAPFVAPYWFPDWSKLPEQPKHSS
jgi:S1-C subfamily serine protease